MLPERLNELQHNIKEYIDQRLSVQIMHMMNFHIEGKRAKLQVIENFAALESGGILDGRSQVDAQALRVEIEALEEFRNRTI